jgi:hypothetical protein
MDPNTPTTPESTGGSKNTLLTLASLLVLLGVVGTTFFLYIQNKQSTTTKKGASQETAQQNKKGTAAPIAVVLPTLTAKELKEKYPNVMCRRFTDLNEALQAISIACILDLSGKDLTEIPDEITKLTKLNEINLSNNKFTAFPPQLLNIPTLISINLSKNQLTATPDVSKLTNLQSLILTGNPIKDKATLTPGQSAPKTPPPASTLKITY